MNNPSHLLGSGGARQATLVRVVTMAMVLTLLCAACSSGAKDESLPEPPFSKDGPMGRFYAHASVGPVEERLCTSHGGEAIAPVDYHEPEVLAQGVGRYKRKLDGQLVVGISFVQERAVLIVEKVCGWRQASSR